MPMQKKNGGIEPLNIIVAFLPALKILLTEDTLIAFMKAFSKYMNIRTREYLRKYIFFSIKKENQRVKKNYPKLSVVGIMKKRQESAKINAIYLLLGTTIVYIILSNLVSAIPYSMFFVYILAFIAFLLIIDLTLFKYRINQGWYGNNEAEAKEILKFILRNSDNIDFTDGSKLKAIISPEDIEEIREEYGVDIPALSSLTNTNTSLKSRFRGGLR